MRHGGGTNLTSHILLCEIAKRDVGPHVSAEVDQDGVHMGQGQTELSLGVVSLDLGSVGVPLDSQTLYKLLRNCQPLLVLERELVSIEVTGGAIELALGDSLLEVVDL